MNDETAYEKLQRVAEERRLDRIIDHGGEDSESADIHNLVLDMERAGINNPRLAARIALRFAVQVAPCRPEWFNQRGRRC